MLCMFVHLWDSVGNPGVPLAVALGMHGSASTSCSMLDDDKCWHGVMPAVEGEAQNCLGTETGLFQA